MRIFHIMLFGVLMQNGQFRGEPVAPNTTYSQPRPAPATTGQQLVNSSAFRRIQRIADRQLLGLDPRDEPLECWRIETENARSLELGARLSLEFFDEQYPEPRTKAESTLIIVMEEYRKRYIELMKLYAMAYRWTKHGLVVPRELTNTIVLTWEKVRTLDRAFPNARDDDYIGTVCEPTANL